MTHPEKHIILKFPRVVFIDWERATRGDNNLTQFLQYLERRFGIKLSLMDKRKYKLNKIIFFKILFNILLQFNKLGF